MVDETIDWTEGSIIYNIGDASDFAYLLKTGIVEIKSKNGTRVGFINKDEVFGDQSIILGTPRTVSAIAVKDSNAIRIPKKHLIKEFTNSSLLIQAILRSTYIRLMNLDSMIKADLENFYK